MLEIHKVAIVVFALVSSGVPDVTKLSTGQIQDIYNGNILNWANLGHNASLGITVISRPSAYSTQATFENYVLGGNATITGLENPMLKDSDSLAKMIMKTPGAIGYVPIFYARKYSLTVISIDGVAPTNTSVENGPYKFWNTVQMYTLEHASDLAIAFIDYIRTEAAKPILDRYDLVSVNDVPINIINNHQA
jgi:phosphate transport system substrate-binding protein